MSRLSSSIITPNQSQIYSDHSPEIEIDCSRNSSLCNHWTSPLSIWSVCLILFDHACTQNGGHSAMCRQKLVFLLVLKLIGTVVLYRVRVVNARNIALRGSRAKVNLPLGEWLLTSLMHVTQPVAKCKSTISWKLPLFARLCCTDLSTISSYSHACPLPALVRIPFYYQVLFTDLSNTGSYSLAQM